MSRLALVAIPRCVEEAQTLVAKNKSYKILADRPGIFWLLIVWFLPNFIGLVNSVQAFHSAARNSTSSRRPLRVLCSAHPRQTKAHLAFGQGEASSDLFLPLWDHCFSGMIEWCSIVCARHCGEVVRLLHWPVTIGERFGFLESL